MTRARLFATWPRNVVEPQASPVRIVIRHGAILVIAVVLVVSFLVSRSVFTQATWTDQEYATSDTLTAFMVPQPEITGCSVSTLLGVFTAVTLSWKPAATYTGTDVSFGVGTAPDPLGPASPAVSGPDGGGVYTATFTRGLLEGLIGALFGTTFYIGAHTNDGTWSSAWAERKVTIQLLGLNPTCTVP